MPRGARARTASQVLKDARTRLTISGEAIDLVGHPLLDQARGRHRRRSCAAPRGSSILLAHDPRRLTEAAALDVPLVLSGHTHGGQVVLPGVGAIATQKFPVVAGIAAATRRRCSSAAASEPSTCRSGSTARRKSRC